MTNSTDAEKAFDKIQNPFIIKKKKTWGGRREEAGEGNGNPTPVLLP